MAWPLVPLSDLCRQHRAAASASDDLPYIAMDQVESNTGEIRLEAGSRSGNGDGTTFKFDARHVLYGKLRPYLNKVATPDFNGKCSTELVPLLPNEGIDRRFLAYVLRRDETIKTVMTAAVGARMPRASMDVLLAMRVPLPPLAEQQRIVEILDRAAAIQRLRRAAEEKAREIIPALFVDMFGDPATNPKGWPLLPIPQAFDDVTSLAGKVERSAYLEAGAIPVFDQGQNESPGFTNQVGQMFRGCLPVILFGDHTRVFRLITQPFVRGADGVRLLAPKQMLNPWYAVAALQSLNLPSLGYSRHYRELKRLSLPIPPYEVQERFALRVQQMEAVNGQIKSHVAVAQDLTKAMLSSSFNDVRA